MVGSDDIDVSGPGEAEILATWARVIADLKASRVCFYLGRGRGRRPDFGDFTGALTLIGDCNALVFSEPLRTKIEVWRLVEEHRRNLQVPIPGVGFIFQINMVNTGDSPGVDRRGLFKEPAITWLPHDKAPDDTRFWGEYARLGIYRGQEERQVHLLHLGLGGLAAWLWFFQPNGIQPARIIGTPF